MEISQQNSDFSTKNSIIEPKRDQKYAKSTSRDDFISSDEEFYYQSSEESSRELESDEYDNLLDKIQYLERPTNEKVESNQKKAQLSGSNQQQRNQMEIECDFEQSVQGLNLFGVKTDENSTIFDFFIA